MMNYENELKDIWEKKLKTPQNVYLNSNSDKLINRYKISTIQRLRELGYKDFKSLDKCSILTTYFLIENHINPFKSNDILIDYVSKKKHLNPKNINYWVDLIDYKPSKKLSKIR